MEHLRLSVKTLFERRRHGRKAGGRYATEMKKVEGAIGTFEVTKNEKGWHPHAHLVVLLHDWIDQRALSEEWYCITGDSFIVDVRRIDGSKPIAHAFAEVCKYALKFSTLELQDTWACFLALKRSRLAFTLGCFRGINLPAALTDDPIEGLPFYDLLYRYVHGRGYELAAGLTPPSTS